MSLLEEATERGLEQCLERGQEQRLSKGDWIGQIHLCQQRLNRPLSPSDERIQLSTDELRQRAETLQAELFGL